MTIGTRRNKSGFVQLFGLCLIFSFWSACGCNKSDDGPVANKYEVADDGETTSSLDTGLSPADGSPTAGTVDMAGTPPADSGSGRGMPTQPPSLAGDQLGSVSVPDGTPEELMQHINQLFQKASAPNVTRTEAKTIFEGVLGAAEKILASGAELPMRKNAIAIWGQAIQVLSQQIDPSGPWNDRVQNFGRKLAADEDPGIASEGRAILFGLRVHKVSQGQDKDTAGMLKNLQSILAEEGRGAAVQAVTQQAVVALRMMGKDDEARVAFRQIAEAFKDHADPEVAKESANMFEQLAMLDLQIESKLNDIALKKEGAVDAFMTAISSALGRPNPGAIVYEKAHMCVEMLEQTNNYDIAIKVCDMILATFKESTDQALQTRATQNVKQAMIRLNMIGKPLTITGTTLDGSAFDINSYQGKVVLLAFWTIVDGQCQQTIDHVRQVYSGYQEKGFDVIGVALDRDAVALGQSLSQNPVPWKTITSLELAKNCGLQMIPFLILLDRQGNVLDLHARGKTLEQKLTELLGPPVKPPAQKPGDVPPSTKVDPSGR